MRARPCWPRWSRRRGRKRGLPGRGRGVDAAREAALVPGGGVVVNHALLGRLVDLADRLRQGSLGRGRVTLGDGAAQRLDLGLEPGHVAAVAIAVLEALPLLLQGRCVMSHSIPPLTDDKPAAYRN